MLLYINLHACVSVHPPTSNASFLLSFLTLIHLPIDRGGDFTRYVCELPGGDDYQPQAQYYYNQALLLATDKLSATHPVRLGLALNYSIFLSEIMLDNEKGCELAQIAFENGVRRLDSDFLPPESVQILDLLRKNLSHWV